MKAFIDAIKANPDDDAPRLQYADWLDENGDPERAEFIRVQCKLADWPYTTMNNEALRRRERELLTGDWRTLAPSFPMIMTRTNPPSFEDHAHVAFRRGFIYSITCTAADCIAHLDTIREEHPVREVRMTDWRGLQSFPMCDTTRKILKYADESEVRWVRTHATTQQMTEECFAHVWPGITFHLPSSDATFPRREAYFADLDRRWQEQHVSR